MESYFLKKIDFWLSSAFRPCFRHNELDCFVQKKKLKILIIKLCNNSVLYTNETVTLNQINDL